MAKFEKALGVWESNRPGFEFELKPTMKDVRAFRKLMMQNTKNKDKLYDEFAAYMTDLIVRHYENVDRNIIEENVELYINNLFEDAMITYKWTTKEELEKSKQESTKELKKLIEDG